MPAADQVNRKVLHRRAAARIVSVYVIFSCLWIYSSDELLAWLFSDPDQLTHAQTIKGWFFVLATAGLLYLYLSHCLQQIRNREEALDDQQNRIGQEFKDRFLQLNTLFDAMNAVVYVADLESYELLYVNRYAEEFFGPGWQGRKCYQYLQAGFEKPCNFCTNPQLTHNGKSTGAVVWEFLNTRNNRWYECFDKAIHWTDDRLVRLEVALDVTERKELEKIRDDLLSSMSHEMRTPLTAISGFAELLVNEQAIPEAQRRHIEIIAKETERLTGLVNRFLDVRRLKTDRTRINYIHLQLENLLKRARAGCRDCKESHDVQIQCPQELQVYGNRQELTQVVTQLLENACRYSPRGGSITLTAEVANSEILIKVADQGIGIPAHELEAIFRPFHRLDTGDTRSTGGVGLGLCLAKEVVALHGGRIMVESALGRGSTFTISLPQPPAPGNSPQTS